MKRVTVSLIALIMVFSLVLAACGNKDDNNSKGSGNSNEPVNKEISGTVRLAVAGWQLENGIDPLTQKKSIGLNDFIKENFNKKFPKIKVEITQIPWGNAQAKQQAMLLSGDVDVLYTGGAMASKFFEQGLLRELDSLIKNDPSFDESIYMQGMYNSSNSLVKSGVHYGLPAAVGQRITVYDKKIFEQWGVEPLSETPTPAEILEKARKMTGKNPVTGEENYGLYWPASEITGATFVAVAGAFNATGGEGDFNDPKNIKWNLNSPEMAKVLEWIKEAAPLAPPAFVNSQGAENFGLENNNIAIVLDNSGYNAWSQFKSTGDATILDRFIPVMNLGPNGSGWVALDPIVMAKKTKNEEAAWELVKFMAGVERHKHWYENFGDLGILANQDYIPAEHTYAIVNSKVASVSSTMLLDEANPFVNSEVIPLIAEFASKAATGNAPNIQAFLESLQKRATDWTATLK